MHTIPGSSGALGKLAEMGFAEEAFAGAVTSGEVTHTALLQRQGHFWETLGNKCIHLTWGARGSISLQGLGLEVCKPWSLTFIQSSRGSYKASHCSRACLREKQFLLHLGCA